jgi:hypothetical protein
MQIMQFDHQPMPPFFVFPELSISGYYITKYQKIAFRDIVGKQHIYHQAQASLPTHQMLNLITNWGSNFIKDL